MGPSIQQLSSAHPPYWRSFCDITGPFYCKLTKFTKKKFWIAGICCVWSRHITYSMLLDMTASEFLQTLKTVSYQNGGSLPRFLHSDFGSQIVTIKKINDKMKMRRRRNWKFKLLGKPWEKIRLSLCFQAQRLHLDKPYVNPFLKC